MEQKDNDFVGESEYGSGEGGLGVLDMVDRIMVDMVLVDVADFLWKKPVREHQAASYPIRIMFLHTNEHIPGVQGGNQGLDSYTL